MYNDPILPLNERWKFSSHSGILLNGYFVLVFNISVSQISNKLFNNLIKDMIYQIHNTNIPKLYQMQLFISDIEYLMYLYKSEKLQPMT